MPSGNPVFGRDIHTVTFFNVIAINKFIKLSQSNVGSQIMKRMLIRKYSRLHVFNCSDSCPQMCICPKELIVVKAIYFAGHNEAEGADANTIWPHRSIVTGSNRVNGKLIYDFYMAGRDDA